MSDRLARLLAHTRTDPELHAWFAKALADWRGGMSLEHALGLGGPRAVRQRDAALRRAADLIDPAGEMSSWKRAAKVEKAIRYFNRVRSHDSPLAIAIAEAIEIESRGIKRVRCQRSIFERLS